MTEIVKQNEKEFAKIRKNFSKIEKELNEIKKDLVELKSQKKIDEKKIINLETRIEKLELKYAY